MAGRNSAPLPAEAERLKEQIQGWRQAKANGSAPMPSDLWTAAIRLAKQFGVCRVSRAVGLDYSWLRKRVADAGGAAVPVATRFLELSAAQIQPMAVAADAGWPAGSGPVIEVSAPDGARMRIRLESDRALDLGGLVASFLGRGR